MINKDRLIATYLELIRIDSPSEDEKKIAEHVAMLLTRLGASVEFDTYGNIIGKISGTGEPFMLNVHLDTVEPGRGIKPQVQNDRITSDGTTILGGDAKAGLAMILEALASLKEDTKQHVPLELVCTVEEEIGLFGAVNLDYTKLTARQGVTFDGYADVSHLILSAPGYNRFDVTITGRAAHAGFEPEKGISAIRIASEIIAQLPLGRIDHETTANVGIIQGGTARNAIPESVQFKAEVRSRDLQKLIDLTAQYEETFQTVLQQYPEASIDTKSMREFDPYRMKQDTEIVSRVQQTLHAVGLEAKFTESGGGSDVNIFHTKGIQAVAVGIGNYNPHTKNEYTVISELVKGAEFCERLVLA